MPLLGNVFGVLRDEADLIQSETQAVPAEEHADFRCSPASGNEPGMDRVQATSLYESGKEPTVRKLLELDAECERLKRKLSTIGQLFQQLIRTPFI
jgi:hypothetical protein